MCSTPPKKYKLSTNILGENGQYSGFSANQIRYSTTSNNNANNSMSINGATSASLASPSSSSSSGSPSSHSQSWRVRRSSFLSEKMMHEDHNSYEVGIAEDGSTRYNLSVKESQGFQWNPDLFVSKYHQQDYYHYSTPQNSNLANNNSDPFNDHSRPNVQDIVIDSDEDIFPTDY